MSMNDLEYETWKRQMQERSSKGLDAAYDAQKTWPVDSAENQAIKGIGPQTYQPKEPRKRTVGEQLNFNAEMLAVLHKELKELFDRLSPLMIPSPDAAEQEKELAELNGEIINRLIEQSYQITRLIGNVRQAQRDLQL
jgi:hypothetical protein